MSIEVPADVVPSFHKYRVQLDATKVGATDFARTLIEPLPQHGAPYEALLDFLFDEDKDLHWVGPIERAMSKANPVVCRE